MRMYISINSTREMHEEVSDAWRAFEFKYGITKISKKVARLNCIGKENQSLCLDIFRFSVYHLCQEKSVLATPQSKCWRSLMNLKINPS